MPESAVDWKIPAATLALPAKQEHTQAWHDLRLTGYTGTDAATLLGVNKFETVRDVFDRKTGAVANQVDETGIMRFGSYMEPTLAALLEDETDLKTRKAGTYQNKDNPLLIANVDRLTSDGGIAEFKTAGMRSENGRMWEAGTIPGHPYIQAQHYALTLGRGPVRFVVGIRNDRLDYDGVPRRAYNDSWFIEAALLDTIIVGPIEPDEAVQQRILDAVAAMDRAVKANDPSMIVWPESSAADDVWPVTEAGTSIQAAFGTVDLVKRRNEVDGAIKELTKEKKTIDEGLKTQLAGHETLTDGERELATYKTVTSNRFDQKSAVADDPEFVARHTLPSESRRLTVKTIKEES